MKHNLLGLDANALERFFEAQGEKAFRARQVLRWVHQRHEGDFARMSDLAKVLREKLVATSTVEAPQIIGDTTAADGTRKWLLKVDGANAVEAVFIPETSRGTLCVSSQAGCVLDCAFCSTGKQGFNRNLATAEIIGQLWLANRLLKVAGEGERPVTNVVMMGMGEPLLNLDNVIPALRLMLDDNAYGLSRRRVTVSTAEIVGQLWLANRLLRAQGAVRPISNVVMMGMGEPLLNLDNVIPALRLMLDDNAYGLSRRRVTVSTSGVIPGMDRLRDECPVALALSLHAPNDALRDELVPVNRKYPLRELMAACNRYLEKAPRDFITFEYVMLDGVNDSEAHAREAAALARQVRCKYNLIPFNPFSQSDYRRSSPERIRRFAEILQRAGITVTTRKTRGDDIAAACGQLAGDVADRTRRSRRFPIKEVRA